MTAQFSDEGDFDDLSRNGLSQIFQRAPNVSSIIRENRQSRDVNRYSETCSINPLITAAIRLVVISFRHGVTVPECILHVAATSDNILSDVAVACAFERVPRTIEIVRTCEIAISSDAQVVKI